MRNLKRGQDLRVSTLKALCRELGLEFYVGPPRAKLNEAKLAPGLRFDSTPEDVARAIGELDRLRSRATDILQSGEMSRQQAASLENTKRVREELEMFADDSRHWNEWNENNSWEVPFCPKVDLSTSGPVFKEAESGRPRIQKNAVSLWVCREELILIEVPDDSMRPTLRKGDFFLIDRSQTIPVEGQLFLALYPFELTIRRVLRIGPGLALCTDSDNVAHPPTWLDPDTTVLFGQAAWHGPRRSLIPTLSWQASLDARM